METKGRSEQRNAADAETKTVKSKVDYIPAHASAEISFANPWVLIGPPHVIEDRGAFLTFEKLASLHF